MLETRKAECYQVWNENFIWLRINSGMVKIHRMILIRKNKNEIGKQQPRLYVHYDKDKSKVQRLNGYGSEYSNQIL